MKYAIHITPAGPFYKIRVGNRTHHFELPPYCGLGVVNRDGDPLKTEPPKALYAAVDRWQAAGKVVDDAGYCVWAPAQLESSP